MSLIINDKKVAISALTASSEQVPLQLIATKQLMLFGRYTVTDASVSAGEDVNGWIDKLEVIADGKTIFETQRDELIRAVELLSTYNGSVPDLLDSHDTIDSDALYFDGLPTTAAVQRFWFILNLPHDLRMYKSAYVKLTWRAVTDEWATASAMAATFCVAQVTGNVPISIGIKREQRATNTTHDITLGDRPIIGFIAVTGSANVISELTLPGKDNTFELKIGNADDAVAGQALWNAQTGNVPADDDQDYVLMNGFISFYRANRIFHAALSSTATMLLLYIEMRATHALMEDGRLADVWRGNAKVVTVINNENSTPSNTLYVLSRVKNLMKQLFGFITG